MEGEAVPPSDPLIILLGSVMPTVFTWATLTLLFMIVPNRRLSPRDAMIGAAVGAILVAALRYTFAAYVVFMTSYQAIYGAIAAVPVFLLWVYLVWLAVLAGAIVTAALPDWRYARIGVGGRMILALEVMARLGVARQGGAGMTTEQLAKVIGAPDMVLTAVMNDLRTGLFIAPTEGGRWVLSRDLERTPLADLVHHFGMGLNHNIGDDDMKTGEIGKRPGALYPQRRQVRTLVAQRKPRARRRHAGRISSGGPIKKAATGAAFFKDEYRLITKRSSTNRRAADRRGRSLFRAGRPR